MPAVFRLKPIRIMAWNRPSGQADKSSTTQALISSISNFQFITSISGLQQTAQVSSKQQENLN